MRCLVLAAVAAFLLRPEAFAGVFAPFAASGAPAIYDQGNLLTLTLAHLGLVVVATSLSALIAVSLAVLVTRGAGRAFLPMSRSLVGIGQTFPPVAVLAVAVPLVGFGMRPALIALTAYGLLPVFENALTGLTQLPPAVLEAADGVGMSPAERLWRIELPLARPWLVEGLRQSVVISVGTATLGSTVAAKGLGEVIIAGLLSDNSAFVLQGGLLTGLMAMLLHDMLGLLAPRASSGKA